MPSVLEGRFSTRVTPVAHDALPQLNWLQACTDGTRAYATEARPSRTRTLTMTESTLAQASALAVVIPTHGRPTLLARTLASLGEARRPPGYRGTIVAENGGVQPEVARIVAEAPRDLQVRLVSLPDGNKSSALNAVLETLDAELVVFLDDDVRVAPALLEAYAEADAATRGMRVFFGGPTEVDYEVAPPEWLRTYLPPSAVGWRWEGDPSRVDRPDFLGFNWAARPADLRQLGGFDTAFGPGARTGATGQESDMQRRMLAAGWVGHLVPSAVVWHYVPRSRCSTTWALRRSFRNGVSEGLRTPHEVGPRMAGVPRWMVRVAMVKAVQALTAQLQLSPRARFHAMRNFLLFVGKLKGIRAATAAQERR